MKEQKNLIKVIVFPKTRRTKDKGVKFTTYSTSMFLIDDRADSQTSGQLIKKSVNVKFGEDVDKKLLLNSAMLLEVDELNLTAPARYNVKEEYNEKGELVKKYPVVWINKIESVTQYKTPVKQSQFVVELNDDIEDEETDLD